jgi:hypothetical protein
MENLTEFRCVNWTQFSMNNVSHTVGCLIQKIATEFLGLTSRIKFIFCKLFCFEQNGVIERGEFQSCFEESGWIKKNVRTINSKMPFNILTN